MDEILKIKDANWDFFKEEMDALAFEHEELNNIKCDESLLEKVKSTAVSSLFREYDLRGSIDIFDEDIVRALSYALTIFIHKKGSQNNKKIVVSSDNEDYNMRAKDIAKDIFLNAGLTVYDLGVVSSPTIYFAQLHYDADAIACFTASHNPYGDMGMKTGMINHTTFGPAGMQLLREQFLKCEYVKTEQRGEEIVISNEEIFDAYYEHLKNKGLQVKEGSVIVLNGLAGTGGPVVKYILERFGIEVRGYNIDPLPSKPGDKQKNPELDWAKIQSQEYLLKEIENLKQEGRDTKKIFAIAFDRDADRMVPLGPTKVSSADEVAILSFRQKSKSISGKKIMAADIKASMSLFFDPVLMEQGVEVLPWYTGHSYLKDYMIYMKKKGCNVIGCSEKSGHIFQEECFDEPLESALYLMNYLEDEDLSLEEALTTTRQFEIGPSTKGYLNPDAFIPTDSILTLKDRKYEIMKEVQEHLLSLEGQQILGGAYTIIGTTTLGFNIRFFLTSSDGAKGSVVLRPSSNEEVFTLNIEFEKTDGRDYRKNVIDLQQFVIEDLLGSCYPEFKVEDHQEKDKKGWKNTLKP